ncbi:protein SSUH2 homolog [Lissotriton helveticus]
MFSGSSLRNASGPNFGSTSPLLGADCFGDPDGSGPYPYPIDGNAASAPPSHLMDNITGYEGISAGGEGGKCLPPPSYPGSGPREAAPPPNIHWSIPSITEDIAKQAFIQFAESKCCYRSTPAKEMLFHDFHPVSTYRYRLETFTESRTSEWKSVPYNGEVIDAYGSGRVPLPWDIPVTVPAMFKDANQTIKVPRSSSVKPCESCLGLGQNICKKCNGAGRVLCMVCNGSRYLRSEPCFQCHGIGNASCSTCHGQGRTACTVCNGRRQLLCFIEMKVTWKNNIHEYLSDKNSGFPTELFAEVTGKQLFTDEQFMVYPLMTFPDASINQASQIAIQQHQAQFASASRIVRQRHTIELIPLTKVEYAWKDKSHFYFVYGMENQVFTDDYPAKCCCSVM